MYLNISVRVSISQNNSTLGTLNPFNERLQLRHEIDVDILNLNEKHSCSS